MNEYSISHPLVTRWLALLRSKDGNSVYTAVQSQTHVRISVRGKPAFMVSCVSGIVYGCKGGAWTKGKEAGTLPELISALERSSAL